MKTLKNKIAAITIAIFFMLSMTASMITAPVNAVTLAPGKISIATFAFINVAPNPIGVDQTVNVGMWLGEPPPTAGAQFGDRWQNYKVTVTLPDGSTTTLGPFTSDDTGGAHTSYTPSKAGNYSFVFSFPGQILAGANPIPGTPPNSFVGDYYEPSTSKTAVLTVQQQPISAPPENPLPTKYWENPVEATNSLWYNITGNWLGLGQSFFAVTGMYNASDNCNPYTTSPTTAHILWTKPEAFGGLMGGELSTISSVATNYYSTSQYEPKFAPIVMNGILYYTEFPGSSVNPAGWAAVDLHTGQTLWTKNTTEELLCGQILNYVTPNQYGGLAYLWAIPENDSFSSAIYGMSTTYSMYDAMTGNWILDIINAPSETSFSQMPITQDSQGDLIGYYVNSTDNTLNMWNSTRCINLGVPYTYVGSAAPQADSWVWRPKQGAIINFSLGIQWSVPLATNLPDGTPIIDYANGLYGLAINNPNNGWPIISGGVIVLLELKTTEAMEFQPGWEIEAGYSATTGAQLWIINRTETPWTLLYYAPAQNGVYVVINQETSTATGYNIATGAQLWTIVLSGADPYDSSGGYQAVAANGVLYTWALGGDVWAINLAKGTILWHYTTGSAGVATPYGVWPIWTFTVGTVAGGMLFVPEGHMYSPPLFHGAQQLALNITNGRLVWSIDAFDVTSAPAVSDGIATTLNAYDNQIYAYGMGPSGTTVSAPQIGVTTSTPVTITGTVLDVSAGTQQEVQKANFPYGVPCVSDASMSQWMEYVYMQQPMPTNVTGVPVTIAVTDSNHNCYDIGTAYTDASGTYSLTWTPIVPGNFTVTATFAGTQSYYGSSAETHFYAGTPAPSASPYPSPVTGLASTGSLELGIAAVIIVIVIIGVVLAILTVRKRL